MYQKVTISKDLVFYHAESAIRKELDVLLTSHTLSGYHIQPDELEGIDKELLHRIIELRDADVRVLLQKYLTNDDIYVDDELMATQTEFVYELTMPENWRSALLQPLATYIHNYLVRGILYDYMKDKMPEFANAYLPDLDDLKESIEDVLASRSGLVKAPLQPF